MNAEKAVMISRIPKSSVLAVMVSPFDADKALHTSEMSQNKCKKCAQSGICLCLCVSVLCKNKHITYGRVSLALVSFVGHIVRYILLLNGLKLIRIIIAVLLLFLVYFKVALEHFLLFDMISMSVATQGWAMCRETEKKEKLKRK